MRLWATLLALMLAGFAVSIFNLHWPTQDLDWRIIESLRIPRAMAAALVGSMLAVCGLLLQVLLRNPLAEPYILGLSGGASVAVMGGAAVGLASHLRSPLALMGALISLGLLLLLTRAGRADPIRLLLTGVLISAAAGAMGSLILTLADPLRSQASLVWLMGDFAGARISPLWLVVWGVAVFGAARLARVLDTLNRGADVAATLGLNLAWLRPGLLLLASVLAAVAVSIAGPIGFVGLVVPHAIRMLAPSASHRAWLPLCAIAGAGLLLWADWLGRWVFDPIQLPAGVVMAVIGIPALLVLLGRTYAAR